MTFLFPGEDTYKGSMVYGSMRGLQIIVRDTYESEVKEQLKRSGYLSEEMRREEFGSIRIIPTLVRDYNLAEWESLKLLSHILDLPLVTQEDSPETIEKKVSYRRDPYLHTLVKQHLTL